MLSDSKREELARRLQDIQRELLSEGLLTEITILGGDAQGNPSVSLSLEAGYWRNSTAACELGYVETNYYNLAEAEDARRSNRWYSSDANC